MELQTLPGQFISHGSPMLALDPEQAGPALHRLECKSAYSKGNHSDVCSLGK